jgi:AhpD family alkylhydroperoxidase
MENDMTFRNFPSFDETSAPAAARDALTHTKRAFGGIPTPLQRYASSPAMLAAALGALEAFEQTSLSALEREVVAMTMGRVNGCSFCLNLHRRLLQSQQAPAALIAALETGSPLDDRRLEALRGFVEASLRERGDVPEATWVAFREGGFSHAQALEVLMGISAYTLTTFANRLTEA